MELLQAIYFNALQHTKSKIYEDIDQYLSEKEIPVSFEQYKKDRAIYIEQIWENVWVNKASNKFSRHKKREFLQTKGIDAQDADKKLLNRLFRTEIAKEATFPVLEWLDEVFAENETDWQNRYEQAREQYKITLQQRNIEKAKMDLHLSLLSLMEDIVDERINEIYVYVRYHMAKSVQEILKNNVKYRKTDTIALEEELEELGDFRPEDYLKAGDFFEELTGNIHRNMYRGRWYFEYETYETVYDQKIADYAADAIQLTILKHVPAHLTQEYKQLFHKPLTGQTALEILSYVYDDIIAFCVEEVRTEYIDNLMKVAVLEFDEKHHLALLEQDIDEKEKRLAAEEEERKRREEEERRMLADIFGAEYSSEADERVRFVLHIGDTNTGKTYHALERMKQAESGIYLAPLRLLALEVYEKLNAEGYSCSLKTGEEEKLDPSAVLMSSTVEMYYNKIFYDVIVIDEAQMIADKDRGYSWYKAITNANANEVHIIASKNAKGMLLALLPENDVEIVEYEREVPLQVEKDSFQFKQVKKGDALICFSRKKVLETASRLQNAGHSVSMIYGSMPPETRKRQVQQFAEGKTKVIVSTDAIGMGLNLPIRRIVFLENEKFDGTRRRLLSSQEVKQIAGRAGRKGLYNTGHVSFLRDTEKMKRLLEKRDEPIHTFSIAPTQGVFERFQQYSRDLGMFFELWEKFINPKGTKKAELMEERELYERVRGTEIEARLPLADLYGFLHLPFSRREPGLIRQWEETMYAIIDGTELPEPRLKNGSLEELELSYKAIGLHLLFLYRLEQRTEALYWERMREEISGHVHDRLHTDVKNLTKKCKRCGKQLHWEHEFQICDVCHERGSHRPRYYRR